MNDESSELQDLDELEVLEISLVNKPASRKKWCLYKSDEGNESMMKDLTAAILSVPGDAPGGIEEILKQSLSKEGAAVVADCCKMLAAVKDELSAGLMKQISDALQVKGVEVDEEEAQADEEAKAEDEPKEEGSTDALDEEEAAAMKEKAEGDEEEDEEKEKSFKAHDEDHELNKSADPRVVALFKKVADLEAVNKAHEQAKKKTAFIAKAAKEMVGIPGLTTEQTGDLLNDIDTLNPTLAKRVESVFKSVATFAESSGIFRELGTAQAAPNAGNAESTIEGLAKARVTKTGEDYTTAYVKVLEAKPELYNQYLNAEG